MTDKQHGEGAISDQAVREKTGKSWASWFKLLDAWGAKSHDHATIANHLQTELAIDPWWAQTITVRYEQERGLRVLGQRADGSFEFAVQRTIATTAIQAYDAFTDPALLSKWFTSAAENDLRVGGHYQNADGDKGQYLLLEKPKRVRFTWDNEQHCPGTLVEVTFQPKTNEKVQVRIQHTKLRDQNAYHDMKEGWTWAITSLKSFLETGSPVTYESWKANQP